MKGFLKPKLILPLVTVVLLTAAIAVPLLSGSISRLPTALSILSRQRTAHAASGDWPTFLFNRARSGFNGSETVINRNTAPHLKVHWTRKVGSSSNGSNIISAEPVEANGMIYWGDWGGVEHASRLSDGTDVWTAQLGTSTCSGGHTPRGVTSTATIATELIGGVSTPVNYVGGGANATFYALNANTGAVIWQTVLSSQPGAYIWSSPAVFNHRVYIGLASVSDCPLVQGKLLQLDALTGAIQHTFNVVPNGCLGGSVWSSPTIDTSLNIVYVSTGNPKRYSCSTQETMTEALVALSTTDLSLVGSWQIPPAQQIPDGDFGATPTLFKATIGGILHKMVGLINKNGIYYAFDRTNISAGPLWQRQLAAPDAIHTNVSSSAWDGTSLYVAAAATTINGTSCNGSLRALNPASGAFRWQDCLSRDPLAPVIAVPGLAVVGFGSFLRIVNSSTGTPLFTFQDTSAGSRFYAAASISNGVLYAGFALGKLYAFGT